MYRDVLRVVRLQTVADNNMDQVSENTNIPTEINDEPKEENKFLTLLVLIVIGVFIVILCVFYFLNKNLSKVQQESSIQLNKPIVKTLNPTPTIFVAQKSVSGARFICPVSISPCPKAQKISGEGNYIGLSYEVNNHTKIIAVEKGILQIADPNNYKNIASLKGRMIISISVDGVGLFTYAIPSSSKVTLNSGIVKKGQEIAEINDNNSKLSFGLLSGNYIDLESTSTGVAAK